MNSTMHSLYVGDLHPDVTEAILFEKFSTCGPVLSIRVCRDMITRRSLCYAYVNFQHEKDAENAMDTLNFALIKERPIRVMWCQKDQSTRDRSTSAASNVFIKNLDKSIDNKTLHDVFSSYGNILSCKIACDENGSKGHGFVQFEKEESARTAIEKVNDTLLNGKRVYVGIFIPRNERFRKPAQEFVDEQRRSKNVFIHNLSDKVDDGELRSMFESFGKIISAKAVHSMNMTEHHGQILYCSTAPKKDEHSAQLNVMERFEEIKQGEYDDNSYKGVMVCVKNLDDGVGDERLRKEFSEFGTITSAKVMTDGSKSKGFGYVCFSSIEEATRAVDEMNGCIHGPVPLYVKVADRYD